MASMIAKSTKKSICVLLDAMIIIEIHALGIWNHLLEKTEVLVPSTVVRDEAFYFNTKNSKKRRAIQISQSIESGEIAEVAAKSAELQNLETIFNYATLQGLDPGELEALALINSGRTKDALFCTADAAAIRALALMGHSQLGISLEKLLRKVGLQKPLDRQYKENFFRYHLNRGKQDRITGIGLRE